MYSTIIIVTCIGTKIGEIKTYHHLRIITIINMFSIEEVARGIDIFIIPSVIYVVKCHSILNYKTVKWNIAIYCIQFLCYGLKSMEPQTTFECYLAYILQKNTSHAIQYSWNDNRFSFIFQNYKKSEGRNGKYNINKILV